MIANFMGATQNIAQVTTTQLAPFGLQPLGRSWRTFPGAKLTNGWGLKDVSAIAGK